jgi:hypothetical protein
MTILVLREQRVQSDALALRFPSYRLGPQLIPVAPQRLKVEFLDLDRPKPTIASRAT